MQIRTILDIILIPNFELESENQPSISRREIRLFRWQGEGVEEVGVEKGTGIVRIKVSPKFYRPTEVETLLGDATKAKEVLGWEPKIDIQVLLLFDYYLI